MSVSVFAMLQTNVFNTFLWHISRQVTVVTEIKGPYTGILTVADAQAHSLATAKNFPFKSAHLHMLRVALAVF